MPNKHTPELENLTLDDLFGRLTEAKVDYFNLRFKHATGQQDNTAALRDARKQIARINTLLRQREIAAAEGSAR